MAGILVVVGTRPEAIKLAPVIEALRARAVRTRICATAQHRGLLNQALGIHGLSPDIDLDLMRADQSPGDLTARMLAALDRVMGDEQPDCVVVQGDTVTALAGAQAAYFRKIPVAHVEAGLRTGDLFSPHPEEGARRMIGAIADSHFAPTLSAVAALKREGVNPDSIHLTGNTVVDALFAMRGRINAEPALVANIAPLLAKADTRHILLVTCHRRESFNAAPQIAEAIRTLAARTDVFIVLPLHPNPLISRPLREALSGIARIALLEPLDFAPFIALLSASRLVLTDSGGVQEEAPILGIPTLVMRETTERPEGVSTGVARLVGTSARRIVAEASLILDNPPLHTSMSRKQSLHGDGRAGLRIADLLIKTYGLESPACRSSSPAQPPRRTASRVRVRSGRC